MRVYNVRFGDAILVSVPDRRGKKKQIRHILIDVGNVLTGAGGDDAVFEPIVRDIRKVLGKRPLDLYVMTHEHMDHVQGLLYASKKLGIEIPVKFAWLTASASEDYYEKHPEAKKRRLEAIDNYNLIERFLRASKESETPSMRALRLNNNPRSTSDCISFLRKLASKKTTYVYRGCELDGAHGFEEAGFEIWAPEEDTAEYYGRFQPVALYMSHDVSGRAKPALVTPVPPPGVNGGSFYDLVMSRRQGYADNLLTIDSANNNTSVVFCLNWRGWRLLFTGDAEQRSWKTIWKKIKNKETPFENDFLPIHFLKISHHGSHTGMPVPELLDKMLPKNPPDERRRYAAVSTCLDCYNNVPDDGSLEEIGKRCEVKSVLKLPEDQLYFDLEFEG